MNWDEIKRAEIKRAPLQVNASEAPADDPVNHPAHYTAFGAEVIDLTEHLNFCRGNAVKYICRAGRKQNAPELEDLRKAQWYLTREIARLEKSSSGK